MYHERITASVILKNYILKCNVQYASKLYKKCNKNVHLFSSVPGSGLRLGPAVGEPGPGFSEPVFGEPI